MRELNATIKPKTEGVSNSILRGFAVAAFLVGLWWLGVAVFEPAPFILPGPERVLVSLVAQSSSLAYHAGITLAEILIGLALGIVLGTSTALLVNAFPFARRTIMPVLVASQALPVFAIAPLLILWFGLGLGSKIAMATLIIYFPIASALNDGLARAEGSLIDLARLCGARPWQTLVHFRLPAAMPSLASGIRVAATVAPIGAVVGEWVGAAAGIGYIINQANARMQTDTVFAGLVVLIIMVIALRLLVDMALDRLVHWAPRSIASPA
ncbi:ABC transporter permease [Pseudahrensia aquimaris]|uniref:ABC transporter permease n=1 Tax=Pseudahrensia aquimaris TaxID=744461 RepID=A0ABW3FER4_9HYPH